MSLHFPCPKCAHEIATFDDAIGKVVICPRCAQHIVVPAQARRRSAANAPAPASTPATAPDEFRINCTCGKSIRVPVKLAGRQGACPRCDRVFTIPGPESSSHAPQLAPRSTPSEQPNFAGSSPLLPASEGSLWSEDPQLPPTGAYVPHNQPTAMNPSWNNPQPLSPNEWGTTPPQGAAHVRRPQYSRPRRSGTPVAVIVTRSCGIAIIVITVINSLIALVSAAISLMQPSDALRQQVQQRNLSVDADLVYVIAILILVAYIAFNGFIAYAASHMFTMTSWGLALTASILAILPCSCYTVIFSMPIGILGIVMLCQPQVRSNFG